MDSPAEMGHALSLARTSCLALVLCLLTSPALARERFAIIVSGASGGPTYVENFDRWRTTVVKALTEGLGFSAERVIVLTETAASDGDRPTRENVRRAVASVAGRLTAEDLLLVVLIGHGTFDGEAAKFNLVGPDLDAREWAQLLAKVPGQLVFVNTSNSSHVFLEELSRPDRIIITATDSSSQRFDTVFPEYFAAALDQVAVADSDKNGRLSIWEAFGFASQAVSRWYDQRGQLVTEHAVLDDNGDRTGREAQTPGPDGTLARRVYLDPDPSERGGDAVLANLERRKAAIEAEIELLKARKGSIPRRQYETEFEALAVELARIARAIRARS
ncbi:MAG TPA: hypothetical protein VH701_17535 [Vicinamibacterales bacterium]|jgi:hypothetical protein